MSDATSSPGARGPEPAYRHVLVPLDGSDLAAGALPTARSLAERFEATVHTIGVASRPDDADRLRTHAAAALGVEPGDRRVHVAVSDDPAAGIGRQAGELGSCLVCMSSHGRGRLSGALLGSVARSVLEGGRAPIVVVGPAAIPSDLDRRRTAARLGAGRLVACVDGGAASEEVLPAAAAWAHALGMALTIVTVAEPSPPPVAVGATWHRHHGPDADADEYMRGLAKRWSGVVPDVQADVVYDPIGVGEGMEDYLEAHPTGLVAVTTHARTGLGRVVFGAGAADIVRVATAPVLVLPLGG
jgi:nucleotide-binding universal stress UspA family protein